MTTYIDTQYKKIKHFIYKKKVEKTKFSKKEFQKARGTKSAKKLQEDLNKIGTCLNGKKVSDIHINELENVCFVICNTYKKNNKTLGVGPLNDGYMISDLYHKKGFQIFYLYDPTREEFLQFIPVFFKYTKQVLTVYYSGRCTTIYEHHIDDTAIVFEAGHISGHDLNEILLKNVNKNLKVVLICDCFTGGSIWSLDFYDRKKYSYLLPNVVSVYSVYNSTIPDMVKKAQKMNGIFTYYFCKFAKEILDISPNNLLENINPPLDRFNISLMCDASKSTLESQPIFN